ncbi:hypothetical protein QJS04_geneDACA019574 [Acorus gramineus]|uniref:CCHC-type domain-containing protein n=1 Tax=Acorus gramineus TaxID=55184 RepID=A0AAV9ADP5_ACOGR|nr:hypothetical protein QJS04_geneDACA019574 [Acorus gramineus]
MQSKTSGGERSAAAAAPTGCFKCGRPGHWSRDCPSTGPAAAGNPSNSINPNPSSGFTRSSSQATEAEHKGSALKASQKAKKPSLPRTRPKLTPEILLSDDGLGYVLRHFPRAFKYHGRGHEVSDLGNLIGLYQQWHSQLLPYYSFDQFVQKVEQVGTTKHVKMCIRELRERVARGGDPTKLHEPPVEHVEPDWQEPCQPSQTTAIPDVHPEQMPVEEQTMQVTSISGSGDAPKVQKITDEQRARMEANRLKALERAAARARASLAP